jgi:tRNA uridine 5-carboxymethylaminomethyl modification enzyme
MSIFHKKYDVIVVGAGHAGCEAALAAARLGASTCLITINLDAIAAMSCNPAVGGLAKGHLVREIDALGGEMAKNTDATGIQFRRLNTSKGPAVRATRAQSDRLLYRLRMKEIMENQPSLDIHQAMAGRILVKKGRIQGIETTIHHEIHGETVIITTGTFLRGLIHIGMENFPAGRMGDPPSNRLSASLAEHGFEMGRLKTGTTPRLHAATIDFSGLERQDGDTPPPFFSFSTKEIPLPQRPCYITYTNSRTHKIIESGFDRSPMFTGIIEGVGARYCPSIEDKVNRFPDRERHQIFLEPEGLDTVEIYPNGIPTSLPLDIQISMIHSIKGLEKAKILRPGYAIEYDYANPVQLRPSLETRLVRGLFFAGQINGTSGYEEAAAQGIMAGINAVKFCRDEPPLILKRSDAYIGVLIDDLVTKGTLEPYRMFTSRAEYRLLLREDNADMRLAATGRQAGLVDDRAWNAFLERKAMRKRVMELLNETRVSPHGEVNGIGVRTWAERNGISPLSRTVTLAELLRRPETSMEMLMELCPDIGNFPSFALEQAEIDTKYSGYVKRQEDEIRKFKKYEAMKLPDDMDYSLVPGISREVSEKLNRQRPDSLGMASRISGITPAALTAIRVFLRKYQNR